MTARVIGETELDALREIGNVLTGSYLTALARITGLRLEPTPPAVVVDLAGAVIGSALAEVAMSSDRAILIESALGHGARLSLGLLFIPAPGTLGLVLDRLGLGG